jgi:hypothetical protein
MNHGAIRAILSDVHLWIPLIAFVVGVLLLIYLSR